MCGCVSVLCVCVWYVCALVCVKMKTREGTKYHMDWKQFTVNKYV